MEWTASGELVRLVACVNLLMWVNPHRIENGGGNICWSYRVICDEFSVTVGFSVNAATVNSCTSHQDSECVRPVFATRC